MLGLETALAVTWHAVGAALGWAGLAERMSAAPARIAGLAGHGQGLVPGAPANVVLVDPKAGGPSTPPTWPAGRGTRRTPAWSCAAAWSPRSCAANRPCSMGGSELRKNRSGRRPPFSPGRSSDERREACWCWRRPHVSGAAFGSVGETFGEAVFNTGMTGYRRP